VATGISRCLRRASGSRAVMPALGLGLQGGQPLFVRWVVPQGSAIEPKSSEIAVREHAAAELQHDRDAPELDVQVLPRAA
jgi:hypothetical protein